MRQRLDPRYWQIGALTVLLLYSIFVLRFEVTLLRAALIVATAVATQRFFTTDVRSSIISGLSLALLLRSNHVWVLLLAAVIAIASKFVLRIDGKHLFNPTNFAIVALIAATNDAWVSPGQWGSAAYFGFLIVCLGGLVVHRAERADVTYAFIVFWSAVVIGRSLWLGEPMTIPLHRLENGALLLFTFFMISDPRTTPDSRAGRILFAALVALGAGYIQFRLFRTNGILWSLALTSFFTPVIDIIFRAERFAWKGGTQCETQRSFSFSS
jgi:Na+-transporting NADH:ubiquinone oxidoreductase subunit NqrB